MILEVENQINETGNSSAGLKTLLEILSTPRRGLDHRLAAAVASCRILYRLSIAEKLVKRKGSSKEERAEIDELRDLLVSYCESLCELLRNESEHARSTALTLLMRIVKAEASQSEQRSTESWKTGAFFGLVKTLTTHTDVKGPRQEFLETFVEEHDDVRYYTFVAIGKVLAENSDERKWSPSPALELLLGIEGIPSSEDQLEDWYGSTPEQSASPLRSLKAHRKAAEAAWLQLFKCKLDKQQRKQILDVFTEQVAPWFSKPEALMDFLTDSYNEGGATSLLALSGVYFLISERNLDYPQFYQKLYSLLDDGILFSKHRARFFRLLETFLSSTHLPANLVASFIKRLSRLALHAPPGGIVMVVPWVYNMLRKHPQCTFMIHREITDISRKDEIEASGMDDPFDMSETDPVQTGAIDSSLWELHTLQQHYHPNVATLAKIISEQFTKQEYNLEDFLDHSYSGLVEAELAKDLKKAPVVEFEIPKRILTKEGGGLNEAGQLLQLAMQAV